MTRVTVGCDRDQTLEERRRIGCRSAVGGQRREVEVFPHGLTDEVFGMTDADFPAFNMRRLVNRNDAAVRATLINGRVAYRRDGGYAADLGQALHYGRFLPARGAPAFSPPPSAKAPLPAAA